MTTLLLELQKLPFMFRSPTVGLSVLYLEYKYKSRLVDGGGALKERELMQDDEKKG